MYKISLGHAGSPYEWWPMPLDNSGLRKEVVRYGILITTKDVDRFCNIFPIYLEISCGLELEIEVWGGWVQVKFREFIKIDGMEVDELGVGRFMKSLEITGLRIEITIKQREMGI